MSVLLKIINSKYLLWLLLAVPSFQYIADFIQPGRYYPEMVKDTGLWGVQLLVFTLFITPISLILRYWNWGKVVGRWLVIRRKYFGLAGAGYGLIHTLLYVRYVWDIELIWLEALSWAFGLGWIAMILLFGISLTSNQFSIARMGKWWKFVQRISYLAIIGVLIHWALLDFFLDDVLVWAIPLALAKLVHMALRFWQKKQRKRTVRQAEPVAT